MKYENAFMSSFFPICILREKKFCGNFGDYFLAFFYHNSVFNKPSANCKRSKVNCISTMPEMDANAFIRMASNITKLLDLKIAQCFRLATTEANNVQCANSNCMLLLRRKEKKCFRRPKNINS